MSNLRQGVRRERHIWTPEEEGTVYLLGVLRRDFYAFAVQICVSEWMCRAKFRELVARKEAERLWNDDCNNVLIQLVNEYGRKWPIISKKLLERGISAPPGFVKKKYEELKRQSAHVSHLGLVELMDDQENLFDVPSSVAPKNEEKSFM